MLDTKSVTMMRGEPAAAMDSVVFACDTVQDGVNGWAVLDFDGIDGELRAIEAVHSDDTVSGTFDIELCSALTGANLLSGESCTGLAADQSHRKRLFDNLTIYARDLRVCGKQQLRVKFSANVVTRVRIVIWYLDARTRGSGRWTS